MKHRCFAVLAKFPHTVAIRIVPKISPQPDLMQQLHSMTAQFTSNEIMPTKCKANVIKNAIGTLDVSSQIGPDATMPPPTSRHVGIRGRYPSEIRRIHLPPLLHPSTYSP